jgi:hypothetical protein
MTALPKSAAARSRAFFLFSGHGLEVTLDKQILLPMDYLAPPAQILNRAISTKNLADGLASHAVGDQLFFSDACRNDHRELRKKVVDGWPILNVDQSAYSNPGRTAPIISASGSGAQAYQPRAANKGTSIFGRALVEGLTARSAIRLSCDARRCSVELSPLLESVRARVNVLAQGMGHTGKLLVPLAGYLTAEPTVTVIAKPPPPPGGGGPGGPGGFGGPAIPGGLAGHIQSNAPRMSDPSVPLVSAPLPLDIAHEFPDGFDPGATSEPKLHALVGSEYMTPIVRSFRFYDAGDAMGAGRPVNLLRLERTEDTRQYRLEIEDTEEGPTWLSATDGVARYDTVLAGDQRGTRYSLDISLEYSPEGEGGQRPISLFAARLSRENFGVLGKVADAWEQYRIGSIRDAVERLGEVDLEMFSRVSPLAIAVSGLMLLRVGRLDLINESLSDLTRQFPDRADLKVVRVAQLLRFERTSATVAEATRVLQALASSGDLPYTSEGFSLLDEQLTTLKRLNQDDHWTQLRLERVHAHLRGLEPQFRSSGMFVTFASERDDTSPRAVLPLARPLVAV